jgi:hypothetical protein
VTRPLLVDGGQLDRIGDALCAVPWLSSLAAKHGGVRIVDDRFSHSVRAILPDELGLIFGLGRDGRDGEPLVPVPLHENFDALNASTGPGVGLHMCQGYFMLAGEEPPVLPLDLGLLDFGPLPEMASTVVLSPFSMSDANHNKAWFGDRWTALLPRLMAMPGVERIAVLGTAGEDFSPFHCSHVHILCGWGLRDVMSVLRSCRLFISIDNGLSHAAHFGNVANHLLLYPSILPAAFVRNPRARIVRSAPIDLAVDRVAEAGRAMLS